MELVGTIVAKFAIYLLREILNRYTLSEKAKLEILKAFDERVWKANRWLGANWDNPVAAVLRDSGGQLTITATCPKCGTTFDPLLP